MLASLVLTFVVALQTPADEAKQIVEASKQKLLAAKTVSGKMTQVGMGNRKSATFQLARPNKFAIRDDSYQMVCDGKETFMYMGDQKKYMKVPQGADQIAFMAPGFGPFFGAKLPFELKKVAMGAFKGRPAAESTYSVNGVNLMLYTDKESFLPLGAVSSVAKQTMTMEFSDVVLDEAIDEATFKFTPPAGANELAETPSPTETDYEAKLLKIGTKAPDFTIKSPKGGSLNLRSSLKGSKGLLLNFWFYG